MMNELRKPRRVSWKLVGGIVGSVVAVMFLSWVSVLVQYHWWIWQVRHYVPLGTSFGDVRKYLSNRDVPFQTSPAEELMLPPIWKPVYDTKMLQCSFTEPTIFGRSAPIRTVFLFHQGRLVVRQVLYHENEDLYIDNDRSADYQ